MIALTREIPESIVRCELTHLARAPIDVAVARAQHEAYERGLASLGCDVRRVPAAPALPDSVFVEDAAVVLDEMAILARPGAPSRRAETDGVAGALAPFRPVRSLAAPATMDGGDVLRLGHRLYVGVGGRTNDEGAGRLAALVRRFGYEVRPVRTRGCLHLKSAVTAVGADTVLVNPDWIDPGAIDGYRILEVDPAEPFAANVLHLGATVLMASAHARTRRRLESAGFHVRTLDVSELAKAEAGVTCCSLVFRARAR